MAGLGFELDSSVHMKVRFPVRKHVKGTLWVWADKVIQGRRSVGPIHSFWSSYHFEAQDLV